MRLIHGPTLSLPTGIQHSRKHSRFSLLSLTAITLLSVLLPGGRSFAADYYVAKTGANSNPGTLDAPWLTVDFAVDNVSAGDNIFVRSGTYNERVTIGVSGTENNYITLRNYPGETAILDGSGRGNGKMVYGMDISWYKIIGLEIQNHTGAGIVFYGDGSNIEIRNNHIHDQSHQEGDGHAIWVSAIDPGRYRQADYTDHLITDVIIDGNTIGPNVETGTPEIFDEALTVSWNVKRFQITNNVLNDVSHIGIDMIGQQNPFGRGGAPAFPQYGYVANNTVKNGCDTGPSPNSAIYIDGAKNIVIEDNLVHDVRNYGITVSAEDSGFTTEQVIVRRNKTLRLYTGIYSSGISGISDHVRVAHNSIFVNRGAPYALQAAKGNDVKISNNIVQTLANPGYALNHSIGAPFSPMLDYNLYTPANAVFGYKGKLYLGFSDYKSRSEQDSSSLTADPLYTDPAGNDLMLQSGSPAIDRGTCLTTTNGSGSNSKTLVVRDSRWFHDGMGIMALPGDLIQVGANSPVRITDVNYNTNQITLNSLISWSSNDCVSYPYSGEAPDMGAYETGESNVSRPLPPRNLSAQ